MSKCQTLAAMLCLVVSCAVVSEARAQYSNSMTFSIRGRTYSQHFSMGRGYFNSGFSTSTPRYHYSANSGWAGRTYHGASSYGNSRYGYSHQYHVGRGFYHGASNYGRR